MSASPPIADRRWYMIVVSLAACGTLIALGYFTAVTLQWLPGKPTHAHTLQQMASSAFLLTSLAVGRRSIRIALALLAAAIALQVWSIASLSRGV
jgi:hypothetical protein